MSDNGQPNTPAPGGQTGDHGSASGKGDQNNPNPPKGGEGEKNTPPDTVPYSRFSEEVAKRNALEKKLADQDAAAREAERKALEDQAKFKELYEGTKPRAERAEKLEAVITKSVDELMQKIPEDRRKLIPASLAPEDKLDYIHTNYEFLTAAEKKANVGAGTNPGTDTGSGQIFTGEQLKDPKFFAEHREEILKAQREGRIKD